MKKIKFLFKFFLTNITETIILSVSLYLILFTILSGNSDNSIKTILNLNSILLSSMGVLLFIQTWKKHSERNKIIEIAASQIETELKKELDNSNNWIFSGGLGSWQRSSVLPTLANKNRVLRKNYSAYIPSPFDAKLCKDYATYRNKTRNDSPKNMQSIQDELLSFILSSFLWSKSADMEVQIYLTRSFSPIRIDAGDSNLFVTVPSRSSEAISIPKNHWYAENILAEMNQKSKVKLHFPDYSFDDQKQITEDEINSFFDELMKINNQSVDDEMFQLQSPKWGEVLEKSRTAIF